MLNRQVRRRVRKIGLQANEVGEPRRSPFRQLEVNAQCLSHRQLHRAYWKQREEVLAAIELLGAWDSGRLRPLRFSILAAEPHGLFEGRIVGKGSPDLFPPLLPLLEMATFSFNIATSASNAATRFFRESLATTNFSRVCHRAKPLN